jgi:hypothetical protein
MKEGNFMKTYVVRKQLRAAVQGMISYPVTGIWTTGKVWDNSHTGCRITGEHPLPIGLETIAFLRLRKEDEFRPS